jgi:hypothetical protein
MHIASIHDNFLESSLTESVLVNFSLLIPGLETIIERGVGGRRDEKREADSRHGDFISLQYSKN